MYALGFDEGTSMTKVLALSQRLDKVAAEVPEFGGVCVAIARYLNALAQMHHFQQAIELLEAIQATAAAHNPTQTAERLAQLHAQQSSARAITHTARAEIETHAT